MERFLSDLALVLCRLKELHPQSYWSTLEARLTNEYQDGLCTIAHKLLTYLRVPLKIVFLEVPLSNW
ncbi:hypothetical protein NTGM5_80044 [Candidatus Nitrotoga sp. M5]|nr:hypothetical protein NTGM5_80044 [Candidatus Nitrotoga sp. M5]